MVLFTHLKLGHMTFGTHIYTWSGIPEWVLGI